MLKVFSAEDDSKARTVALFLSHWQADGAIRFVRRQGGHKAVRRRICCSRQIRSNDAGEHDPIEGAGAADAGDAGGDFGHVAEVEQIGADERAQHPGPSRIAKRWILGNDPPS